MILFNKTWLEHHHIQQDAKQWLTSNMISKEQYEAIKTQYATPLYTPTLFIRILLFIFTYIALSGVCGIVFFTLESSDRTALASAGVMLGSLLLFLLEHIITTRKLYKSGFEEACLYMSLWGIIGGFLGLYFELASQSPSEIIPWMIVLPFLMWGTARFADRLTTAAAYISSLGLLISVARLSMNIYMIILAVMFFSVLCYFLARKYRSRLSVQAHQECLIVIEALSLLTFYGAGNYFVISQGNTFFSFVDFFEKNKPLRFQLLFYTLTLLTPLAYMTRGLIIRDRLSLRMGLLTLALSALTFRYYIHFIPLEVALTLSGLFLFLIAIGVSRYLKTEPKGLTSKNILEEKSKEANIEGWMIGSTLHTASPNPTQHFEGSGGKFGGGGTGGGW